MSASVGPVTRDEATAAFFDGTSRGEFLLRLCPEGHYSEPDAVQCSTCSTTELSWVPAAGEGTVVSWSVVPGRPRGDEPGLRTILLIAELDEGPWWWSQLVDAGPERVAIGARLSLVFRRFDDQQEWVPVFTLA